MNRKKRLIKIAAASGIFPTRNAAESAIRLGKVQVDGVPAKNPQFQLDPKKKKITFEGKPLSEPSQKFYFAFNKPAGYTCEKNEQNNVYSFLGRTGLAPEMRSTLSAVGRLDKETTGLLIFTNDGDFAHRLLSPQSDVKKEYHATILGRLSEENTRKLREGVEIEVENKMYKTKPAKISVEKQNEKTTDVKIILNEGKKRQIRKMFSAIGNEVMDLKRVKIAKLELKDLRQGQFLKLRKEDIL